MCKKIHQFIKRKNCNHCYLVKILFFIMSLYQNIFIFDKAVSFMFAKWKEINIFFLNEEIFGGSLSYIVVVGFLRIRHYLFKYVFFVLWKD